MYTIVFIRHGQSVWNKTHRFTGWTDVDLTDQGVKEAKLAAKLLEDDGYTFDVAYTSVLKRAIRTLWIILDDLDLMWLPVNRSWRLNERHYGALQGLDKKEMAAKHGEEQVHQWRRGFEVLPPLLEEDDERWPGHDRRYADLKKNEIPRGESLKLTIDRVLPYWNDTIVPDMKSGRRIIIAAHGNSLRALVKHLDQLDEDAIMQLNIPTGVPLVYRLDENAMPLEKFYLGDQQKIEEKMQAVAAQGSRE